MTNARMNAKGHRMLCCIVGIHELCIVDDAVMLRCVYRNVVYNVSLETLSEINVSDTPAAFSNVPYLYDV